MPERDSLGRFVSAGNAFKNVPKLNPAALAEIDKILAMDVGKINQALVRIGELMAPILRTELAESYRRSGLHVITGQLLSASATNARVESLPGEIQISFGTGYDVKVYIRGNAFLYGTALRQKAHPPFFSFEPDQTAKLQAEYSRVERQVFATYGLTFK